MHSTEQKVGEISVFIANCSDHRKEAFMACELIIERIKHECPIWKKDVFVDGERWRSEKLE
ncbi:MAG: molybdenum cofactor biosynthesis protein MoaE [Candidatus Parvarchaeota archaeon]